MGNLDFSANADQLKELAAYMASQINVPTIGIGGGYAPIGTIISVMGTTAPQDYLACDGTVYNIADYPQLADYFESQFGESNHFGGNGTTTFAVPDLQGEFLRGTGTNSHTEQGSGGTVGEHQDATGIPYIFQSDNNIASFTNPSLPSDANNNHFPMNLDSFYEGTNSSTIHRIKQDQTATSMGKAGYYSARPTNTSVLYCIKAVVAGEVYSTEERVVGTWIDGKPLYQKCYQGVFPSTLGVDIVIGNISDILSYDASDVTITKITGMINWIVGSNYGTVFIPYYLNNPDPSGSGSGNWISLYADNSVGEIKASTGTNSPVMNCPYMLVIQYTKTTDG